jgi:hypothetical protein
MGKCTCQSKLQTTQLSLQKIICKTNYITSHAQIGAIVPKKKHETKNLARILHAKNHKGQLNYSMHTLELPGKVRCCETQQRTDISKQQSDLDVPAYM